MNMYIFLSQSLDSLNEFQINYIFFISPSLQFTTMFYLSFSLPCFNYFLTWNPGKNITTAKKPINSTFLGRAKDFVVIKYNNAIFDKIQQNQRFQVVVIKNDGISSYIFRAGRNIPAYQNRLKKVIVLSNTFDFVWPSHGDFPL